MSSEGTSAVDVRYYAGKEIWITTPGTYAMDTAVSILRYLESKHDAGIPNTGWKNGYGLEVAVEIPISLSSCTASLFTDGDELCIKRVAGSGQVYDEIMALAYEHVSGRALNKAL